MILRLLTLFTLLHFYIGHAMSIAPLPLKEMILKANTIVYGQVVNITEFKSPKNGGLDYIAHILIQDRLKYDTPSDTVKVMFNPNMACPSPPRYELNNYVLAFLRKKNGAGIHTTFRSSHGVKVVNQKSFSIYKARIQELLAINELTEGKEKDEKTTAWIVECIKHQETRKGGLMEFEYRYDSLYNFKSDSTADFSWYIPTKQQISTLRKVYFSPNNALYHSVAFMLLIEGKNNKKLIRFLEHKIKTLELEEGYQIYPYAALLKHYANLSNRKDLLSCVQTITEEDWDWAPKDEDILKAFNAYKRLL